MTGSVGPSSQNDDASMSQSGSDTAVLLSGGLDSCILVGHLLDQGVEVQPIYIQSDLVWERAELPAARRFLSAVGGPRLRELIVLAMPLGDLYGEHWSRTGCSVPGSDSPDDAVFLPGRNALLVVKAGVWCQLNGIPRLALAPLGTSPFADASESWFATMEAALGFGAPRPLRLLRPFGAMNKQQVMQLGRHLPLGLTVSCLAPVGGHHCGRCNKCAERRAAFLGADLCDPTFYASGLAAGLA
jgi:7-cyano-7-deazaguanine synthase